MSLSYCAQLCRRDLPDTRRQLHVLLRCSAVPPRFPCDLEPAGAWPPLQSASHVEVAIVQFILNHMLAQLLGRHRAVCQSVVRSTADQ
jgi:hypothetical protein